jgi:hypothetical protein
MSLDDFFGTPTEATNKTATPPLPHRDEVMAGQLQFFDNSTVKRAKGRSRFSLKLELYLSPSDIDIRKPDWWRVVQLIEPAQVKRWADRTFEAQGMTAQEHDAYLEGFQAAKNEETNDPNADVWMGHVPDPSQKGTVYHIGCFVIVTRSGIGQLQALVHGPGGWWGCPRFVLANESHVGNARKALAFYDPKGILEREHRERRDKAKQMT